MKKEILMVDAKKWRVRLEELLQWATFTHETVTIIGTSDPDVVRTKENDLNVLAMTVQDFEECLRIIRDRYTLNVFQHDPTRIVATDGKLRWQHTVTFRLGRPVN